MKVLVLSLSLILGTTVALDTSRLDSWRRKVLSKTNAKTKSLRERQHRGISHWETTVSSSSSSTASVRRLKNTRIIGGTTVGSGRYPYYAYVEINTTDNQTFFCSATLIWEDILLSSAHCITDVLAVQGVSLEGIDAYVGLESLDALDTAEFRQISTVIPNDNFDAETQENDIMLFKLATPIRNVSPVRMNFDPSVPVDGQRVDVFGFGALSAATDPQLPDTLQTVAINVIPFSNCNDANSFNGAINDELMICAGTAEGGKVRISTLFQLLFF
jgi:secreted trypsin-like serine protease